MHIYKAIRSHHPADALLLLRQRTAQQHRRIEQQRLVRQLLSPDLTLGRYGNILAAYRGWYGSLEQELVRSAHLGSIATGNKPVGADNAPLSPKRVIAPQPDEHATTNPEPLLTNYYAYLSRHDRLDRDLTVVEAVSLARGLSRPGEMRLIRARNAMPLRSTHSLASGASPGLADQENGRLVVQPSVTTLGGVLGVLYVIEGSTQGGRIIAPRVEALLGLEPGQGTAFFRLFDHRQWPAFRWLVRTRLDEHEIDLAVTAAQRTFASLHAHLDAWCDRLGLD